jgi:KDO2-lipid IV(A) lauroyltransferase
LLGLFLRALAGLPLPVLYGLAGVIYFLVFRVFRVRRRVVEANLARSFPEKSGPEIRALARQVYRNYSDVLVEMLHASRMSETQIRERVAIEGGDLVEADLKAGRPVLVVLGHHCNIGWMLLAACLRFDYPVDSVYRPLSNSAMERLTADMYTRFGARLVDDRSVIRAIRKRRGEPRLVTMVCDQAPNINDDVYWTRFLNQETGFYLAPGLIARFTGYPVYFVGMRRRAKGEYTITFTRIAEPPYDEPQAIMPAYVKALEEQVIAAPADWFWMHRRWKRPRSAYRKTPGEPDSAY